jgi:hypothetical protein
MSKPKPQTIPVLFHEVENGERFYSRTGALCKKNGFCRAKVLFRRRGKSATQFFWPFSGVHLCLKTEFINVITGEKVPRTIPTLNSGVQSLARVEQPNSDNGITGPTS